MFELKPLSVEAIPAALEKATRYRLLNEPGEAESICQDILRLQPEHQQALVLLLLAITDRFDRGYVTGVPRAREALSRLRDAYDRAYYAGIIAERHAKALLRRHTPGCGLDAYEHLLEAMTSYEQAEGLRPAGNDDARLRWNACARLIMANKLEPRASDSGATQLE